MEHLGNVLRNLPLTRSEGATTSGPAAQPLPPKSEPACPTCGGLGYLRRDLQVEQPGFGEVFPCECTRQHWKAGRVERLLKYAQIPALYQLCTFQSFQVAGPGLSEAQRDMLCGMAKAAREFASGVTPYRWLVLTGGAGVGKSHLAAAIINARVQHPEWAQPPGIWLSAPDLLWRLRQGYQDGSYDSTLDALRVCPLLVVDDLGAEYRRQQGDGTSWAVEQLYMVLDHRMNAMLETVITTNESLENLGGRLGDRLQSTRNGLVKVVSVELPSYRSGIKR